MGIKCGMKRSEAARAAHEEARKANIKAESDRIARAIARRNRAEENAHRVENEGED
jgi:hypothetical protein